MVRPILSTLTSFSLCLNFRGRILTSSQLIGIERGDCVPLEWFGFKCLLVSLALSSSVAPVNDCPDIAPVAKYNVMVFKCTVAVGDLL